VEKPLCPFADPPLNFSHGAWQKAGGSGGYTKVDEKLNNAVVATAIGAFLRRLRREGRNPDRWETEQAIRAMAFLACDRYLQAIDHVGRALIPPSKRDPVALTYIEEATSHLVVPDLATLQGILDEICDGGGALAQWMGEPAGGVSRFV
jgi:hypothetical protein